MKQSPALTHLPLWLLLSAQALACSSDADEHSCSLVGCGPALHIDIPLKLEFEAIQALSIDVCRNDVCLAGTLAELREPTRAGEGFSVSLDPGGGETHPFVDATIWLEGSQDYRLELMWWPDNPQELQDGDRYVLELTRADGTTLLRVDETVDYEETYPNGVECDVTPCRSAALEVEP